MREQLLQRIVPMVEQLAEQLVDMLLDRVDQHVNQLELAFDAATSAFASDLNVSPPVAAATDGKPPRRGSARDAQIRVGMAEPTGSARNSGDSRDRPAPQGKRTNSCRKCGAVGFTARTCGVTHNVSTSPATRDSAPPPRSPRAVASSPATSLSQAPPPISRSDRLAQIEAARARSEAARREAEQQRDERARSFVRRGRGPTRGASVSIDSDGAEEVAAELPEPVASFDL